MLYSQIIGEGSKELLVIHGLFGSGDNWKSLAKNWCLRCDLKIHLLDLRNHGNSFWSDQMDFCHMSQDISNYAELHNLKEINLLGHSLGGRVAMYFASNNPSIVKQLIVVDIGPGAQPSRNDQTFLGLEEVMLHALETRKEADRILKQYIDSFAIRLFLLRNLYYNHNKQLEFSINVRGISKNREILTRPLNIKSIPFLETYLIRGENSKHCPPTDIHLIRKCFPKAQLITIKNAGHWVHADNPNDFTDQFVKVMNA
ncbi:MAG: alpha/beta fold hydrolase [Flavobacteriaceae bacterium]|nr:alpha/beta fold hydrolase [Flavobacteriaceae bacterium]